MNAAIQNTVAQYFSSFIENVSTKYNISQDELTDLWKETQKEKIKIKPRRRVSANKTPSAYINFCNHHRKNIKADNPNLTFGEVAKALGSLWKQQSADEKQKYKDPAYVNADNASATTAPAPVDDGKKVKRARKVKN